MSSLRDWTWGWGGGVMERLLGEGGNGPRGPRGGLASSLGVTSSRVSHGQALP